MRHEIASTVGDTAGVTQEVGQDPTVGLSRSLSHTTLGDMCPNFCTMCGQEIVCVDCGEEPAPGIVLETDEENAPGVGEHSSKK